MSAVVGLGVGKGILSPDRSDIGLTFGSSPDSLVSIKARQLAGPSARVILRSRQTSPSGKKAGLFIRDRRSLSPDQTSLRAFPVARKLQILSLRHLLPRRSRLSRSPSHLQKLELLGQPIPAAGDSSSEYETVQGSPLDPQSLLVNPLAGTASEFFGSSPRLSKRSGNRASWQLKAGNCMADMQTRSSVSSLEELAHLRTPLGPPGHVGPTCGERPCSCPEVYSSEDEMPIPDWAKADRLEQVDWNEPGTHATNGRLTLDKPTAGSAADRDMLERSLAGLSTDNIGAYHHTPWTAGSTRTTSSSSTARAEPWTGSGSQVHRTPTKTATGVPVFVMLPLDTVSPEGVLRNPRALAVAMQALRSVGVTGVMVDVWWGVVERDGPGVYDWRAYQEILQLVKKAGLLLQAVMSFHACGGNVGDDVNIPLPAWVHEASLSDPDIFYTDRASALNPECVSLFADNAPCLMGRTPIQVYTDFMIAFRRAMGADFGSVVMEVAVGMGPCGELRYPAYPEGDGRWQFPGVGEFQCYDRRALGELRRAAQLAGQPAWGYAGPHDAGDYNSRPHETGFFNLNNGSWNSPYGHFFLQWYSGALIQHGDRMLQAAKRAFHGPLPPEADDAGPPLPSKPLPPVKFSLKCAGIHWWYHSVSHAAELTAGYYNPRGRNGYAPILELCRRYGADFNFTCVEMRNQEQPLEAQCGPQELLNQVRVCAAQHGVMMTGENALARWDQEAYDQMVHNACSTSVTLNEIDDCGNIRKVEHKVPAMGAVTYLRLTPQLFEDRNFSRFLSFVKRMQKGVDTSHVGRHPQQHGHYVNHAYGYAHHH